MLAVPLDLSTNEECCRKGLSFTFNVVRDSWSNDAEYSSKLLSVSVVTTFLSLDDLDAGDGADLIKDSSVCNCLSYNTVGGGLNCTAAMAVRVAVFAAALAFIICCFI